MNGASPRMPMSVRLTLAVALLIVGLPVGCFLVGTIRDRLWPWARDPDHVVVHVQNDSPMAVTLRYGRKTAGMRYPYSAPSPLAAGEQSHDILLLPAGGVRSATLEFELTAAAHARPLMQRVTVVPDEHLLYTIDELGAVTLQRGRESRVGYPVFGSVVAVVGGVP